MARMRIGGKNLIRDAGATLTAGSAAVDHPASNLKIPAPSEFLRMDDLTLSYVQVDLGKPRFYDTVAILYSTATVGRNLLSDSDALDTGAKWAETNLTVAQGSNATLDTPGSVPFILTATGTGEHHTIHSEDMQAYSSNVGGGTILVFTIDIVGRGQGAHLRLRIDWGATEFAEADFDLDNDTVQASSGSDTVLTAITNLTNSGGSRCTVVMSAAESGNLTLPTEARIQVLDSTFTASYTQTGERLTVAVPKLHFGTSTASASANIETYESAGPSTGGVWRLKTDSTAAIIPTSSPTESNPFGLLLSVAASEDLATWRDELGWSHAWGIISGGQLQSHRHLLVELHDADNADGQIDLSSVWVGATFQPATNKKETLRRKWQEDTNASQKYSPVGEKMRRWELELHYLTKTEAETTLGDILLVAGQSREILVILDPDDTTTGQQGCLYGKIVQHGVREVGFDGLLKQVRYAASMELLESVP